MGIPETFPEEFGMQFLIVWAIYTSRLSHQEWHKSFAEKYLWYQREGALFQWDHGMPHTLSNSAPTNIDIEPNIVPPRGTFGSDASLFQTPPGPCSAHVLLLAPFG